MIAPPKNTAPKVAKPRSSRMWIVLLAAAIAVAAALSVLLLSDRKGTTSTERKPTRKVVPAAPANPVRQAKESDGGAEEKAEASEIPPIRFSDTNSPMWRVYHHKGPVITNKHTEANASLAARVFSNTADKFIGQLISIEPGTPLYGPPIKYDEKFVRSFLRSLTTPIIIDPDDPPEVAALKRAVRETKIELKARYDDGEDIAQIMTDTRKELQELGLYRNELQAEVNRIIRKDAKNLTDEEMQDFVDAANKMLAERGAKPIALPGLMKHRLKMKLEAKQGEEGTTNQIQ